MLSNPVIQKLCYSPKTEILILYFIFFLKPYSVFRGTSFTYKTFVENKEGQRARMSFSSNQYKQMQQNTNDTHFKGSLDFQEKF